MSYMYSKTGNAIEGTAIKRSTLLRFCVIDFIFVIHVKPQLIFFFFSIASFTALSRGMDLLHSTATPVTSSLQAGYIQ